TFVETIKIQNLINLKGFEDHKSPKTLGWKLLDKNQDLDVEFVAILCHLTESETYCAYRLVILDLRQQPFTSGVVAMDNLQVKKPFYVAIQPSPFIHVRSMDVGTI
ncbi:hypothetical protein O181_122690, partial [Austropuccinia psidii MF-1]|nr:hypothetical protein [Austropuccinia psidii MF-1]